MDKATVKFAGHMDVTWTLAFTARTILPSVATTSALNLISKNWNRFVTIDMRTAWGSDIKMLSTDTGNAAICNSALPRLNAKHAATNICSNFLANAFNSAYPAKIICLSASRPI